MWKWTMNDDGKKLVKSYDGRSLHKQPQKKIYSVLTETISSEHQEGEEKKRELRPAIFLHF